MSIVCESQTAAISRDRRASLLVRRRGEDCLYRDGADVEQVLGIQQHRDNARGVSRM